MGCTSRTLKSIASARVEEAMKRNHNHNKKKEGKQTNMLPTMGSESKRGKQNKKAECLLMCSGCSGDSIL